MLICECATEVNMRALGKPFLTAADIGKLLGWETRRARRWLISSGAGRKCGGRYIVTVAGLCAHFPEIFSLVMEREDE
jgi:hypothetical protein